VALFGGGAARLAGDAGAVTKVRLRLVQPSIAESLKWDPSAREANFHRLVALSEEPGAAGLSAIIWPEAAATYFLGRDTAHRAAIAATAPPGGVLITGALRTDPPPAPPRHVWNSLFAIAGDGRVLATYDKFHLVPFGEYVP